MTEIEKALWERIELALDRVRPAIRADGGDVELAEIDTDGGVAAVRMLGACVNCPMAHYTLQMGITNVIRANVPEIQHVVALEWDDDDYLYT